MTPIRKQTILKRIHIDTQTTSSNDPYIYYFLKKVPLSSSVFKKRQSFIYFKIKYLDYYEGRLSVWPSIAWYKQ